MEQVETVVALLGASKFVCEQCTTDHQLCERYKALNLNRQSGVMETCRCLCVSK